MKIKTIAVNNSLSSFTLTPSPPQCERDHPPAVYLIPSIPSYTDPFTIRTLPFSNARPSYANPAAGVAGACSCFWGRGA